MDPIKRHFQWAVQALAQPAEVQPTFFPSFVVVADELALDFGNWRRAFDANSGNSWSAEQRRAVEALDEHLSEMSGDKPELWLVDGCLNHAKWTEVRRLAANVLVAFGWSSDVPPADRSLYAQCEVDSKKSGQ
jgi:hypothetical protein